MGILVKLENCFKNYCTELFFFWVLKMHKSKSLGNIGQSNHNSIFWYVKITLQPGQNSFVNFFVSFRIESINCVETAVQSWLRISFSKSQICRVIPAHQNSLHR